MNNLMMKVESLFKIFMRISFGELHILTESTPLTPKQKILNCCISKHNFLKLITENATISIKIIQILSQCLHYKAVMAAEIWLKILSIDSCYYLIVYLNSKKMQTDILLIWPDNKLRFNDFG
jgi:hypothetical protein